MSENLRITLDILALAAIGYTILRGIFTVGAETTKLREQIALHAKWIDDHKECNEMQVRILNELREDIAYLRGRYEAKLT